MLISDEESHVEKSCALSIESGRYFLSCVRLSSWSHKLFIRSASLWLQTRQSYSIVEAKFWPHCTITLISWSSSRTPFFDLSSRIIFLLPIWDRMTRIILYWKMQSNHINSSSPKRPNKFPLNYTNTLSRKKEKPFSLTYNH